MADFSVTGFVDRRPDSSLMAGPERRRRRPPVSCILCRRRKIKCDRQHPCGNCVRSNNKECVYERTSPPPAGQRSSFYDYRPAVASELSSNTSRDRTEPSRATTSVVTSSTGPSTPGSLPSTGEVEALRLQIKQLEEQLSKATQKAIASNSHSPNVDIRTTNSHLAGTIHIRNESLAPGQSATVTRTIMHKRRLFGQSHWINGTTRCLEMFEEIEPFLQDETSQVCMNLQKCKYLAKIIKSRRTPQWPTPPTTDMPAKEVADALVDIYLRTIESVYRILHIPSFRQDYEALWAADTAPDMAFLVQLKLIFSIGAAMYDDHFSLLPSAIRWVHEAQTWFSEPEFKTRLTISFLQTNILLLLAREIVGVDGTLTWISAGSLFRTAVYMGLHRDPAYLPRRSTFAAEMHRRIWNTILEITLQMSMESGGPPLLSMDDFDTNPPGNLDDDQITIEDAVPKPPEEFTQMSIALALRRLFPVRLAIMRSLNSIGTQNTYDETLRLDSELRATYKSICRTLQASHSRSGGRPSKFQTHRLEYLVQRYFLALHVPFFAPAMQETAYAFTRRVVLESCIKAWCALHPSSSMMGPSSSPAENQDLTRLVTCGFGLARAVSMLVSFLVSAELQAQLQEDESLGPVPLRRDLLTILDDAKTWSWKSIEAGEMNTKGYMLLCMTSAQIEGMVRGLPKEQFPGVLVKAAEDATARSLSLLEERAGGNESDSGIDFGELGGLVDSWPDMMGDWGFLVPDAHLDLDDFESMNWAYSGST